MQNGIVKLSQKKNRLCFELKWTGAITWGSLLFLILALNCFWQLYKQVNKYMVEEVKEYMGGCFCGSIRYRATGQLGGVSHCHCSMCRRVCGAPFVTWVSFNRANFSFTCGTPTRFKSSDKVERSFCNRCGTALTFEKATRSRRGWCNSRKSRSTRAICLLKTISGHLAD